jgi:hypothetical protein
VKYWKTITLNLANQGHAYDNVNEGQMICLLLEMFVPFFKRSIPNGVSLNNWHLVILDGHGNHVTLEAIQQAQEFGLNMITLPTHTSHAPWSLDISYFKSFKITF